MRFKLGKGEYIFTRVAIIIVLIVILFPLLWIISLSFRQESHMYEAYFYIIPKYFTISNFKYALDYSVKYLNISFGRMFLNSAIVTFSAIIIAIVISIFAAFGFSQFRFKGKHYIFNLIIISMMIPAQVLLIPMFFLFSRLHLLNTYFSLILLYAVFGIPISVLILRGFFGQIPPELREASRIDGANDLQYLIKIILPISRPAIASCIIFLFLQTWNEFLFAIIFIKKGPMQTLPAAISRIGGGQFVVPWGIYSASIIISALPVIIIFIIFQKWFIEGVTLGALKG